ncbi:MAG: tetratricopeptide repeat protein [Magnetococcales bacterium]|nr:tetratricopeptide repeat protein [Magnetococcales bacterium]
MVLPPQQNLTLEQAMQLAIGHHQAGRLAEAEQLYRQILVVDSQQFHVQNNLSMVLQSRGALAEALQCAQNADALQPHQPELLRRLGVLFQGVGNHAAGVAALRRAVALQPDDGGALNDLASLLRMVGELQEAIELYHQALCLMPESAAIHYNLGKCHLDVGDFQAAEACYRRAMALQPDLAVAYDDLGLVLAAQGDRQGALESHQQAIALQPDLAVAHNNLGALYFTLNRTDLAKEALQQALTLDAGLSEAQTNLGNVWMRLAQPDRAEACYQAALHGGVQMQTLSSLFGALLYRTDLDAEALFRARCMYVQRAVPPGVEPLTMLHSVVSLVAGERLRIGYLSSDLYDHPVGRNVAPLLLNHDRDRFEVHLYAEGVPDDELSRRFRASANAWVATQGMTDRQVARRIWDDGIHILIILAAHLDRNRVMIAVHRPAPLILSFHAGATTGLEQVDGWLTDAHLHPLESTRERFTETLYRLPVFYAYPQPVQAPPVSTPPCLERGFITFGSFNDPVKITPAVLVLWGRILQAVPAARLMLKYQTALEDPPVRSRIIQGLEAQGVAASRLDLISVNDTHVDHLAAYGRVDIALDPFPFTGATTTFQALWMGVPVISLAGECFIHRMASSLLHHIGLERVVAADEVQYQQLACDLAANINRLTAWRLGLREQVAKSVICDGSAYAQGVEEVLASIWANSGHSPLLAAQSSK